jgi:tetratricopeptide (TPR) repeat protein
MPIEFPTEYTAWVPFTAIFIAGFFLTILRFRYAVSLELKSFFTYIAVMIIVTVLLIYGKIDFVIISILTTVLALGIKNYFQNHAVRKRVRKKLSGALKTFEQYPDNSAILQKIASVYQQMGENKLAIRYYRKAFKLSNEDKVARLIESLEKEESPGLQAGDDVILKACPACEEVDFKGSKACSKCRYSFFRGYQDYILFNLENVLGNSKLLSFMLVGLAFIPVFLFYGIIWYVLLIAVWSPALTIRGDDMKGKSSRLKTIVVLVLMMAVFLLILINMKKAPGISKTEKQKKEDTLDILLKQ